MNSYILENRYILENSREILEYIIIHNNCDCTLCSKCPLVTSKCWDGNLNFIQRDNAIRMYSKIHGKEKLFVLLLQGESCQSSTDL